jgi:putative intracellular protease/amidase
MATRDVHLYLAHALSDWEVGYTIANLNQQAFQKRPGRYRIRTVGPTREPVMTMGGLRILPDLALAELSAEQSALLILPGSDAYETGQEQAVLDKAKDFERAGVPIAAICGATAGLARVGLLDARAHTSNASEYLAYQPGYDGAAHYRDAKAVRDRGVITASATAPVDFAREIFLALDVYDTAVLDAWYGLYSTGEPRYFHALMQASAATPFNSQSHPSP